MDRYIDLLKNNEYEKLANISLSEILVECKYQDKYLIEYLLEKNIHSEKMDNFLIHHDLFVKYYLKYDIIEPLLNCRINTLFKKIDNKLIFDLILDKLDYKDKIKLYYNLRKYDYNEFHYLEREIIDIYLRQGIILPIMFITTKLNKIEKIELNDEILKEFKELFKDTNPIVLDFIINELKRCLIKDRIRTINDIKKIIKFKKEHPTFNFINSTLSDINGYFFIKRLELATNTIDSLTFNHEFSHFLFQVTEKESIINEYEKIRQKLDTKNNYLKVKKYLEVFHYQFYKLERQLKKEYDDKVRKYYGKVNKYFKKVYLDFKDNTPDFIKIRNLITENYFYLFVTKETLKDSCMSFVKNEKNEYVFYELRKRNSSYLMLENMLDAIFKGKLFDDLEFNCLSGHGSYYFSLNNTSSFDECLANYDAIKKSSKGSEVINVLKELIGSELIEFLDDYIKINREESHEKRKLYQR